MGQSTSISLDDQLSYSLRRQHVDEYLQRKLATLPAASTLLDLGGVKEAQRGNIVTADFQLQVTTLNIIRDKGLDLLADAAWLPIREGSFDAVLCSEVLEHVPDPRPVLAQIHHVLKPGGNAILTAPFMFRQHADPTDYGRYTEWFWKEQLTQLGFSQITIEKQGLFGSVFADMLRHYWQQSVLHGFPSLHRPRLWLLPRLMAAVRRRALGFDSGYASHPVWSSYVAGFGIHAIK